MNYPFYGSIEGELISSNQIKDKVNNQVVKCVFQPALNVSQFIGKKNVYLFGIISGSSLSRIIEVIVIKEIKKGAKVSDIIKMQRGE